MDFDLVIIGSGSGNSLVTPDTDGWSIAIVEQSTFGGTCLNVGCIPTKMYVYPADRAAAVGESAVLGVDARLDGVRWADIRDRIFTRIDAISAMGRDYRAHDCPNVTLYESHARFVGPHELELDSGERITGERIVVATGSRAWVPPVVERSGVPFHTSDTVMRLDALPRRVTVLGGGYISAEFAHVFASFGCEVTVVARGDQLVRSYDEELVAAFGAIMATRVDLHFGHVITHLAEDADGVITLTLDDGTRIDTDLLLVATGRVPNADRIGAEAAGLDRHEDGRLVVDEYQRTSVEGVWALGDVSSPHQLKHVANHEARVVAHNLAHPDDLRASDHRFVPSAVFTHPQLASVGLTEQAAREAGIPYVAHTQPYAGTAYGWAMADTTSLCKVLADPVTGHLLGAHLLGEQAATLIQPLVQAMSFGLTAPEMARGQYWIHPALTEVVENALLGLKLDA